MLKRSITYNLEDASVFLLNGTEEVFKAIKEMVVSLPEGSTYHHFFGFNDQLWNESGLTNRAREDVVPVKVAKRLQTRGLYFPTDWVIQRFGGEVARREHRNYDLLPEGIEIFSRFYVYGDTVFPIFRDGEMYNGALVTSRNSAEQHRSLIERMKEKPMVSQEATLAEVVLPIDERLVRSVATFALLDCSYDGFNQLNTTEPAKRYMQQILCNSRGVNIILK